MAEDVAADMVIGGTRFVFAERLERAEARLQAVRDVVRDNRSIIGDPGVSVILNVLGPG